MKITLSYTICKAEPWDSRLDAVGNFTLRTPKTPEELRQEKLDHPERKPKKFKFTTESCFYIQNDACYFLIGSWHRLREALEAQHIEYEIEDKRDLDLKPEPDYAVLNSIEFREGQREIVDSIIKEDCGLICSSVGAGKSFVITQICRVLPTLNILVVCNASEVIKELYRNLCALLPGQVGLLDMKHNDVNGKRVIVTTTKSMNKIKAEQVQLLLVDECHCAGLNTTGQDLQRFCFCRRFGFTATPTRNQGDYKYFEALFGPILHQMTFNQSVEAGNVTPIKYSMLSVATRLDYLEKFKDTNIYKRMWYWSNKVRNRLIAQTFYDIRRAAPNAQILIMTKTVEHLIRICELIPELKFAHGDRGDLSSLAEKKRLRDVQVWKYRQTAEQLSYVKHMAETGDYKSIISTGIFSTGINLLHLTVLIRVDGETSGIPSTQIPGRLARLDIGKDWAYLIDFADDFCESAYNRAVSRAQHYYRDGLIPIDYCDMISEIQKQEENRKDSD